MFPNLKLSINSENFMKKPLLFFVLAFLLVPAGIHADDLKYSRVKILLEGREMKELASLGIALDNIQFRPGQYFIGEYSESEIGLVEAAGFTYEVLVDDLAKYYTERNAEVDPAAVEKRMRTFDPDRKYQTPENFSLGSMGGFHTNSELLDELDDMRDLFPDLISAREPISDTLKTIEGRDVYWVRISNNPDVEQDKPRVLYTGLTHAREPASMQQMLFQMWYILENYETDPEIQYLVDNMEMYFVPNVNPDGYIYNEITNPHGGGMHRKNRRNTSTNPSLSGVDINRNFGYKWGYDNTGSSGFGGAQTYRGTSPFSEPETRLQKMFAEHYNFRLALNNHTYSDLLIYPWGYENMLTPDSLVFIEFARLLTRENNYVYGTVYETLNYFANGVSDDWFYGEQETKDKTFAFTPEAGSVADGFWPAIHRIEDICAGHTGMNLYLAHLALPYAELEGDDARYTEEHTFHYSFDIKSFGLDTPAVYTVSINPISPLIVEVSEPVIFENMGVLDTAKDSIKITLHPATYEGLLFDYEVVLDNGMFAWRDTVTTIFGLPQELFADKFADMENWQSDTWGLDHNVYYSSPASMADSPGGNYSNNVHSFVELKESIDLEGLDQAFVEFKARWDIERGYDFVQFMISNDNGTSWIPMKGNYTEDGTASQDAGKPLYHGTQDEWVKERISLDEFLGEEIKIRFRFKSDHIVTKEGFFFDNFYVFGGTLFEPQPPVITGQQELTFESGEVFTVKKDYLQVEDDFVEFPEGHTLNVFQGADYALDGNTVTPNEGFSGWLSIPVTVENGLMESDTFDLSVEILEPVSVFTPEEKDPNVFFDRLREQIVVDASGLTTDEKLEFVLYDVFGRVLYQTRISSGSSPLYISLKLSPGVYLYELRGERGFSGKVPVQ